MSTLKYPSVDEDKFIDYLSSKFSTLNESKAWLADFANIHQQVIQDGEYKGLTCSINFIIRYISAVLGEKVESPFDSSYYWELRDHFENNVVLK